MGHSSGTRVILLFCMEEKREHVSSNYERIIAGAQFPTRITYTKYFMMHWKTVAGLMVGVLGRYWGYA